MIVNKGATLQYGAAGGATGSIGHFPYKTDGFALNGLNIKVDGTLDVAVTHWVHLGIISGSGFILQRRNTWPGLALAGDHPFSGVLYNGTGMVFASPNYMSQFPNVRKVLNQGSAIMDTAMDQRMVVGHGLLQPRVGQRHKLSLTRHRARGDDGRLQLGKRWARHRPGVD